MPASFWCRDCGEPVRLAGPVHLPPEYRKAVHAATGLEEGPGHFARPTDEDPVLRAQADAIEAESGGLFRVCVRFGVFRADWSKDVIPPGKTGVHYEAPDAEGLRRVLRAVTGTAGPEPEGVLL